MFYWSTKKKVALVSVIVLIVLGLFLIVHHGVVKQTQRAREARIESRKASLASKRKNSFYSVPNKSKGSVASSVVTDSDARSNALKAADSSKAQANLYNNGDPEKVTKFTRPKGQNMIALGKNPIDWDNINLTESEYNYYAMKILDFGANEMLVGNKQLVFVINNASVDQVNKIKDTYDVALRKGYSASEYSTASTSVTITYQNNKGYQISTNQMSDTQSGSAVSSDQ